MNLTLEFGPYLILFIFLLFLIVGNIKIVPQSRAFVLERLGKYHVTWQTGLHIKIPLVDKIARIVSLKEQVVDFLPQPVITKDNVTMQIDTVLYFFITDPKLYTYGVENPLNAIENLTATTLRNIIGELELDQSLTSRDVINTKMRIILDEATDVWGVKVNRVELKNILPPADILQAMEKQMRAERERRESIIRAEGEKRSEILRAEGMKASAILRAEGEKESAVRRAEGDAEALLKINEATARSLQMIKDVNADAPLLALKSMDALVKVADGNATKIIIPSDMQNIAGLITSLTEISKS